MKQILFVSEDKEIYKLLKVALKEVKSDIKVWYSSNSWEGLIAFSANDEGMELVIADLQIKPVDGIEFIKHLKKKDSFLQTIILTDEVNEASEIASLELGIDRYLSKDINMKVLIKYIESLLNNSKKPELNLSISKKENIILNNDTYEVYKNKQKINLTNKEFDILRMFLENKGQLIKRENFIDGIWERTENVNNRVVDTHIKTLRKKLETRLIATVYSHGYRWEE